MSNERQKTILLVEDEAITAMAEKMTLEKYGYKVITVSTGEEAVDTVKKTPGIDLILMDINLGAGIDGTEAAAIILRERDLPVVFLSSHMEPEVVAKTEKITSYGYVVKNSSITVLDASIKMAFKLFEAIKNEKEKESQREAAFDALRESEQRLNFHVNNSPLATIEWTTDFTVTRWSGEAEKLFGWKQSETIGKPMMDLQMIYDEDIPLVQKTMARLSDGSSKHVVSTNRNYTKEGKVIICEWYNSVLLNPQGKMISVMSQAMDITERKRVEEQIQYQAGLLQNVSDAIIATDKNSDIQVWNKAAENIYGWEAKETIGKKFHDLLQPEYRYQSRKDVIEKLNKEGAWSGEIIHRNRNGKQISVQSNITISKDAAGDQAGMVSINHDITERKRAESQREAALEALRESEEKYRTLVEKANEAIIIVQDGVFVFANRRMSDLLGVPAGALEGTPFIDFVWTEDRELVIANYRKRIAGEPVRDAYDFRIIGAGGRLTWISLSAAVIQWKGKNATLNLLTDITERKRAEEVLQQYNQKWEAIITASPDGIGLISLDGKLQLMSDKLLTMYGYSVKEKDEVINKIVFDFIDPSNHKMLFDNMRKLLAGKKDFNVSEYLAVKKDNSKFYVELNSSVLFDSKGDPESILFVERDITERKQAESQKEAALAALRESEERQQLILATLPIAIFTSPLDPEIDASWVSGDVEKVTGFTVEQYMAEKDFWRNRLHADDRERVLDAYKNPAAGEDIVLEYRWLCKDGNYKWFYDRAIKKHSRHGIQYFGIILDITERKRVEEALHESEEKFRGMAEKLEDVIFTTDNYGTITYISPSASRVFGWLPEEMIGRRFVEFLPEDEFPKALQAFQAAVSTGQPNRNLNLIMKRRDDSLFFGELNGSPMDKERGNAGTLGLICDITERKQAEAQSQAALEALSESEERFRTLYENSTIGIYRTTPDGMIHLANPALVRMLGYSSFADLSTLNLKKNGFESSNPRTRFVEIIEKDGEVKGLESAWTRKDGTIIFVRESARAIRDSQAKTLYYDGTVENITERKQAEAQGQAALEALSESEDRYRDLVENSQDLICTHDLEGKILSVNEAASRLTGYSLNDLLSMNMADLLMPGVRRLFKLYLAEIQAAGRARGTMRIRTAAGETRHWEYYNTLRTKGVTVPVVRGLAHDITERKLAEEEIKRQLAEKVILLKEVHHRIKNNIASIGGLISLRLQSTTNPEAIAVLQEAVGRVNSMRILYDKLLLSEDYKDISVKNYVESLVDSVVSLFPDMAKVAFDKQIADFHLDSKRLFPLGAIINELLTNIMKYAFTDKNTGLIKISLANVANHVTLTIQDNGLGLPAGFDINESEGFGLKLVKMLSQQLGGSFSIKKHAGTRCKIEFNI